MIVYYFFAAIAVWIGIKSLLGGVRYADYVRREMGRPLPEFYPFVSVIAPTRGHEEGFVENIKPLLAQDYPRYEIQFVFDDPQDPSLPLVQKLNARTVISGPATDTGQKVHNLIVAMDHLDPRCEVIVFVDTDARPSRDWLRQLVAPLADENVGASTGYRWFIPERGGLASRLRGVWNASVASALGAETTKNFCWGGSTAIRRSTFEELKVAERWRGTVSDDFTITRVLKEAKLPIHFTPRCLVPSVGDCGWNELVEFTTRQIKITRVYAEHLWVALLLGSSLFAIAFFGGIVLLMTRVLLGQSFWLLLSALVVIFALGAAKGCIRWRAVSLALPGYRSALRRDLAAHIFLWPFASLLYLYNAVVAAFSRRITWRGITYNLLSPTEAVIISRDS
ncbi:MAG TPA: glycosyltransferase family 2 protein [Pyrinomonadaceae bacterium]|nr:glycosyltransferase family 2 protein [Pyrinomonadaceae bacterium]